MRTSAKAKPVVLILDRASFDSRVLEALVRPLANVTMRSNIWKTIELLESRGDDFDAIMIEDKVLDNSSISDFLPRLSRPGRCRIVALVSADEPVSAARLRSRGVTDILAKPYNADAVRQIVLG